MVIHENTHGPDFNNDVNTFTLIWASYATSHVSIRSKGVVGIHWRLHTYVHPTHLLMTCDFERSVSGVKLMLSAYLHPLTTVISGMSLNL